ncbi:hypothetical protein [Dysgonomonas termitidis]|uniref:Uncharacterized protein n=1 Tax=Dysgonomonas termitidis TaxID=1516126 RepID=A0ABV9KPK9_9BACT
MLRYNFKDKYTDIFGVDVSNNSATKYYSPLAIAGDGTRRNPANPASPTISGNPGVMILSQGIHRYNIIETGASGYMEIIGSGINGTTLIGTVTQNGSVLGWYFKDMTLDNLIFNSAVGITIEKCKIITILSNTTSNKAFTVRSSLSYALFPINNTTVTYQNNNSFAGISSTIGSMAGNLHTWEKCNLIITQASLDSYKNNYYAFDNCNFRIGTETGYTPLTGTTAEDLRTDFVNRCTAAGLIVPPDITDYGITLPLGRWIFTKNQIFEGITWAGSEINLFEIPRFILFGYSAARGTKIPITASNNIPASFAPANPHSPELDIADDSLSVDETVDITQRQNFFIDSKIIWLGGKKKLTNIDIPNDLPSRFGVLIDSIPNLLCDAGQAVASGSIEAGEIYMVRSSDTNSASVTYNGTAYNSALSARNNIFKGVAGVTAFTVASGNPVVYKVNDILNYQSIQVRIVSKIPEDIITSGNLAANYWYIVEHDTDQGNTTDYVTVGGVNYYVGDSFLVPAGGAAVGSVTGTVHLRRVWNQDFDIAAEAIDADFWQNKQKPEWCDTLPEDPRCLMKDNHALAHEMARGADGRYITSGHPEYYNLILAESGILCPDNIYMSGAYMQVRLPVTTVNPM